VTNTSTMNHGIVDRIRDRLWKTGTQCLSLNPAVDLSRTHAGKSSVSGNLPWISFCAAYADGTINSDSFRRYRAVRDIVETACPTEARHYIKLIRKWGEGYLRDPKVIAIDGWGDPIRCPRFLLGTRRPFSPTTLRYLATALWLQRSGKISSGEKIVEIGVGFGGLVAMNRIVSQCQTVLVDLPQVEKAAARMLHETGLDLSAETSPDCDLSTIPMVVSNYAFTELNRSLQDQLLERYLRHAKHGLIVSNAAIFASKIGGRTDDELVSWLRNAGLPATCEADNELLTPIDHICGVRLICW
jgi:hypothetical protein